MAKSPFMEVFKLALKDPDPWEREDFTNGRRGFYFQKKLGSIVIAVGYWREYEEPAPRYRLFIKGEWFQKIRLARKIFKQVEKAYHEQICQAVIYSYLAQPIEQ